MKTLIQPTMISRQWLPRRGIAWEGQFLPFPEHSTGDQYCLIEHVTTNGYGYYEGKPSRYELFNGTLDQAITHYNHHCICGIITCQATFRHRHHRISQWSTTNVQVLRKQG